LITDRATFAAGAAGAALLGAAMLFEVSAAPPQGLPPPPGARVVTISPRPGFFNEPSVAINPNSPNEVAAAFQSPAMVSYSQDAGASWQLASGTSPSDYKVSGDVSIVYDILGHAILCYIAFDKLGTPEYWAHNAARNGVFVRRSLDGGKTWGSNAIALDAQPTRPDMPFEDKPYLVADDNPDSPFAGNLYVGWTEFSLTKSIVLFSRSTDGGITWSPPFEISTHEGVPRDDNGAVEGFDAVAGPDGALYTVWADDTSFVMAVSHDGGLTFGPSRPILTLPASYFKVEDLQRANGFPQIGIDPRTERLYLTWSDYRNGDVDVFCSSSPDLGSTWTAPVRVNNDPVHDGADQFFQWMAVDPKGGSINVVFYDRRSDPENNAALITLARSTDRGKTFANYAWTQSPFYLDEGEFIGDYTGIAALNGRVYGVWAYSETHPPLPRRPQPESRGRRDDTRSRAPYIRLLRSRPAGTIVQLGIADFSKAQK
jgi:BNR/Asp-box repeat